MGMYPGGGDIKQEQVSKATFKQRHKQLKQKKKRTKLLYTRKVSNIFPMVFMGKTRKQKCKKVILKITTLYFHKCVMYICIFNIQTNI